MHLYEHHISTKKAQQMSKITNMIREDIEKSGSEEIQELINKYNKKIDEKLKVKEQELMTI